LVLTLPLSRDGQRRQRSGRSAAIGLGFRIGRGILDVEYTQVNPRTDFITVGYILPF